MKNVGTLALLLVLLHSPTASGEETSDAMFSAKPIWVSGSSQSGGDGNARWLDADQDGDLDLVTSAPSPRRWVVFASQNGKLDTRPSWGSVETTDCDHISVLDFNGDGRDDLAGTHESHCTLYLNTGNLNTGEKGDRFFPTKPSWETGLYTDANQIDFGDYDNDGDLDMVMASGLPVYSVALFENADGALSRTVTQTIGPREYSETAIFADFDSDGDLDVLASYGKRGTIMLFRNQAGRFDEGTVIFRDSKLPWCQRIYSVDIDRDGDQELFCARGPWGPPGASIALTQRDDASELEPIWRSDPSTGFHGFDFRDVDQDGDLDVAAADWGGRSVSVYLQTDGVIESDPVWSAKVGSPAHEVMFGDMDGDGDLDLAVGCLAQAVVFENRMRKPSND